MMQVGTRLAVGWQLAEVLPTSISLKGFSHKVFMAFLGWRLPTSLASLPTSCKPHPAKVSPVGRLADTPLLLRSNADARPLQGGACSSSKFLNLPQQQKETPNEPLE